VHFRLYGIRFDVAEIESGGCCDCTVLKQLFNVADFFSMRSAVVVPNSELGCL